MVTKDMVNCKSNNTHRPIKRIAHLGMHVFPIPFPIGARHYNQCKPVFSAECFRIADSTDMSVIFSVSGLNTDSVDPA